MGMLDKVVSHGGGVAGQLDVVWEVAGNLVAAMEECSMGSGDPSGEEASLARGGVVNGSSMVVGQDVDLGIESKISIWFVLVLVALDVKDVGLEWELLEEGTNGLDDVIVRHKKLEGRGLVVDGVEEVLDNAVIVYWDREGRVFSVGVAIGVALEEVGDPSEASVEGSGFGAFGVVCCVFCRGWKEATTFDI
jgi:hypothetical protein